MGGVGCRCHRDLPRRDNHAVAVLDALQPRSNNLLDGFDPSSAPTDFGLLGERMGHDSSPAGVDGLLVYASDQHTADAPADLELRTFTRFGYPGYLRTWIGEQATRRASRSNPTRTVRTGS